MARPTVRTSLNGRRPGVSHAKPPAAADPEDEGADDEQPSTSAADEVPAGPVPVDSLSEMMSGLQGANTARIHVYRIVKNQPPAYVFECDPTTFSLDDLRDKYNGGEFRLFIMKNSRLWRNMRVLVEPKQVFHGADPSPPVSHVADMMALMRDSLTQQTTMIRDMLSSRPPAASPFSGMDVPQVITAIAAAITALRPAPAPVAPPAPDNSEKALDMFMRGLEIAQNLNQGGDTGIGGMLRDVLRSPIVAAAVQSAIPSQQAQQPRPAALPNPQPPAQVSHAKPAEPVNPPQQDENKVLAYYLGFLVGKAQSGAEPSLYAELVLDNVPDAQLTPMLARGDGLIDHLIGVQPLVAQHREWFSKLLDEINDLLEPEPEGADTITPVGEQHATDTTPVVVLGQSAS